MIDWKRVDELKSEVGHDDFDEIVEIFLSEVAEAIEQLEADPHPADLSEKLHFLKGCSLNLGLRKVSELCQVGETLSANGAITEVDTPGLIAMYKASVTEFLENAASRSAA
jgi:HPt (histidine-containing phosphotransfer) domain-containing protein